MWMSVLIELISVLMELISGLNRREDYFFFSFFEYL